MICIVCNASPSTGFGHLMRSRALARIAHDLGERCILVGPPSSYRNETDATLFTDWIEHTMPFRASGETGVQFLTDLCRERAIRHIVLDDYTVTSDQQKSLISAGLKLLQQYDASDPPGFYVDFAVNASPAESAALHASRILRPDVTFLNGPRYAVLRQEFQTIAKLEPGRPVRRILATFGAGDDRGCAEFVVRSLAPALPDGVKLALMIGRHNPNADSLRKLADQDFADAIELRIDEANVSRLMASCDLAVMAGGTSVYEAAFCGLPMVLVAIADNQISQCLGWERLGGACYAGRLGNVEAETLVDMVRKLINRDDQRRQMAQICSSEVDGRGGQRLLAALLNAQ